MTTKSMMRPIKDRGRGPMGDADVLAALEPDQLVRVKRRHYGRRQLSAGTLAVMWGLRVYAILMVLVVIYSFGKAIHAGR